MAEQVVPDEAYWQALAREQGPGAADAARIAYERSQPAGPIDAPAATVPNLVQTTTPAPPPMLAAQPGAESAQPVEVPPTVPPAMPPEQPFTPPGPQTVSQTESRTQIQGGQKLDPKLAAEQKAQEGKQLEAMGKQTEALAKADERAAAVEKERADRLANERLVAENRAEQHRLEMAAQMKKQADAQKELDEQKPLAEDTGLQKVGKAITLALGSLGASLTGGRNGAADIISADRDAKLTAWKAEYVRRKGRVDNAQNLYAQLRQKGLDDETATAMAAQNLNKAYDSQVAAIMAESKAPATIAGGQALRAKIAADNAQQANKAYQSTQSTVTKVIDERTKTGSDAKDQGDLLEQAAKNEEIKQYKETRRALTRFNDMVKSGADGAALADFIAGKGGLQQGSFGQQMIETVDKLGFAGKTVEQLRAIFKDGVRPGLIQKIGNALASQTYTARSAAMPAIKHFAPRFKQAGINPEMITGGESSAEAAAQAGAAPSAYQGAH